MSYLFISEDKLSEQAVIFDIINDQGMQLFFLVHINIMIIMDTNFIAKHIEMVIIVAFASL